MLDAMTTGLVAAGKQCAGVQNVLAKMRARELRSGAVDEFTSRRERHQMDLLKGALWQASVEMLESLFNELCECAEASALGVRWSWEECDISGGLPPAFADRYTVTFMRRLILASSAVTSRLVSRWTPPVSVIEEIAVCLLMDRTWVVLEKSQVKVDPVWRVGLERALLGYLRVQELWHNADTEPIPQKDHSVDNRYLPENWCLPFSPSRNQAPYVSAMSL